MMILYLITTLNVSEVWLDPTREYTGIKLHQTLFFLYVLTMTEMTMYKVTGAPCIDEPTEKYQQPWSSLQL